MRFVNVPTETAQSEIAAAINEELKKGSVLLLVSGGSNIQLAVNVRDKLDPINPLTVGLVDERYGPFGHKDSNWTQLMNAGFNTDLVYLLPVIIDGQPIANTSSNYMQLLQTAIDANDKVIAIFGLGADGHTSGILPGSPAVDAQEIVTHFIGPDFPRITTTPVFMPLVNKAFLVSYGTAKHEQLAHLKENLPVSHQPVQTLKQIEDLTIYCDFDEENR